MISVMEREGNNAIDSLFNGLILIRKHEMKKGKVR